MLIYAKINKQTTTLRCFNILLTLCRCYFLFVFVCFYLFLHLISQAFTELRPYTLFTFYHQEKYFMKVNTVMFTIIPHALISAPSWNIPKVEIPSFRTVVSVWRSDNFWQSYSHFCQKGEKWPYLSKKLTDFQYETTVGKLLKSSVLLYASQFSILIGNITVLQNSKHPWDKGCTVLTSGPEPARSVVNQQSLVI